MNTAPRVGDNTSVLFYICSKLESVCTGNYYKFVYNILSRKVVDSHSFKRLDV